MDEDREARLTALARERERLEQLLMLDVNWRALQQLEAGSGDIAIPRAELERSLSGNRLYAARARVVAEIAELKRGGAEPAQDRETALSPRAGHRDMQATPRATLASRIVVLDGAPDFVFRTRVKLKTSPGTVDPPTAEAMDLAALTRADARHANVLQALGLSVPSHAAAAPALDQQPGNATASPASAHDNAGTARVICALAATTAGAGAGLRASRGAASRPDVPDRLDGIRGLDAACAALLLQHGVTRYAQIAAWSSADVAIWQSRLAPFGARISKACWIEQAALLASGADSHHIQRREAGSGIELAPMPPPEPARPDPSEGAPLRPSPQADATGTAVTAEDDPGFHLRPPPLPGSSDRPDPPVTAPHLEASIEIWQPDRPATSSAAAAPHAPPKPAEDDRGRPRSLVRRLQRARKSDRFDADRHAAYRGVAEEASVVIVRRNREPGQATAAAPPAEPEDRETAVGRFFKALMGRG